MKNVEFLDHYEAMEVSPNASGETIERVFRYFGQRLHPDNSDTGDAERFLVLLEAYTTLRDPEKRAAYDTQYRAHQEDQSQLVISSTTSGSDSADRHRILSLFYGQRRRDMRQPGTGMSTLERALGCPSEVLEFHLWYLRQKEWIKREESGLFAITAEGIDRIESSGERITAKHRAITMQTAGKTGVNVHAAQISSRPSAPHTLKRRSVSGLPLE